MRPFLPALILPILAACAAPGPTCRVAPDMATIDRLISETQGNLDRGSVMVHASGPGVDMCLRGGNFGIGVSLCTDGSGREKPVAVDAAAERRKLAGLKSRKIQLQRQMESDPACRPFGGT